MSFFKGGKNFKMSKRESVLEDLCDKIVDVIHENFTKKYYTIRISQAKNDNIYLIIRKKRGRLLSEEKLYLCEKMFGVLFPLSVNL